MVTNIQGLKNGAVFIKLHWATDSLFIHLLHFAEKFEGSKTEFCEQTVFLDKTFPITTHIDMVKVIPALQHRQLSHPCQLPPSDEETRSKPTYVHPCAAISGNVRENIHCSTRLLFERQACNKSSLHIIAIIMQHIWSYKPDLIRVLRFLITCLRKSKVKTLGSTGLLRHTSQVIHRKAQETKRKETFTEADGPYHTLQKKIF